MFTTLRAVSPRSSRRRSTQRSIRRIRRESPNDGASAKQVADESNSPELTGALADVLAIRIAQALAKDPAVAEQLQGLVEDPQVAAAIPTIGTMFHNEAPVGVQSAIQSNTGTVNIGAAPPPPESKPR